MPNDSGESFHDRFTDRGKKVLKLAKQFASESHHKHGTPEHVLYAMTQVDPGAGVTALCRLGADLRHEIEPLKKLAARSSPPSEGEEPTLSAELKALLAAVRMEAQSLQHNYMGTEHFAICLLQMEQTAAAQFLIRSGITAATCRDAVQSVLWYKPPQ